MEGVHNTAKTEFYSPPVIKGGKRYIVSISNISIWAYPKSKNKNTLEHDRKQPFYKINRKMFKNHESQVKFS